MAPGSQEATFLSEDEHEEGDSSMARVSDKVPLAHRTKSITSTDVGSPRESEAEDSSVSSKDQLRARVYSLLREVRSDTSSPGVGSETRWSASKEEILEEMVAKSTEIDFLKSDKTSLKELTNSEFCKTEEELD
jgi:hypothetical protein